MSMTELSEVLLGPLTTIVLAYVGVWATNRQQRRDREHRRRQTLEQASQEVTLIEAWIRAYERVAHPDAQVLMRGRAQADLERAYSALKTPVIAEARLIELRTPRTMWSTLLLRYIRSPWAKFLRFLYYVLLAFALLWAVFMFAVMGEAGISVLNVVTSIIGALVGLLPALAIAGLAHWANRGAATRQQQMGVV